MKSFWKTNYETMKNVLSFYDLYSMPTSGFISTDEATSWMDLMPVRGKGLYVNAMYALALQSGAKTAKTMHDSGNESIYLEKYDDLRSKINEHFWWKKDADVLDYIGFGFGTEVDKALLNDVLEKGEKEGGMFYQKTLDGGYYLPFLAFRDSAHWFESLGNLLTVHAGVASPDQASSILNVIDKYELSVPYPTRVSHPPIPIGDRDWRYYMHFDGLNQPGKYHNGGRMAFCGWV